MSNESASIPTLASTLQDRPIELRFGTSGRRGLVRDLSQLEIYINVRGELDFLLDLPKDEGGITQGEPFFLAYDLRPSSTTFSAADGGRGELAQAAALAVEDAGLQLVNLGALPTPALTAFALAERAGSLMITGSHIPFDRNGYKMNSSVGELMKHQEPAINEAVARRRTAVYAELAADSLFGPDGMLLSGHRELPATDSRGEQAYLDRYLTPFGTNALKGYRLLFYQHSSVGRELGPRVLRALGAEVKPVAPSTEFVPIDTENLEAAQLAVMQAEAARVLTSGERLDAVVSMDGDADRPLFLWLDPTSDEVHFLSGDLLGMLTAEFLRADAVVVPVSCNDAVDRSPLAPVLRPRTRIGSPFVIDGMAQALAEGRQRVCGWEANGGFLLGSPIAIGGGTLAPLPTRDAMLPLIATLLLARHKGQTLPELIGSLPQRFGATALLKNFPRADGLALVTALATPEAAPATPPDGQSPLERAFVPAILPDIMAVDRTDGVRVRATNGDVVHLRPSGNADEFRIYALADIRQRAEAIAATAAEAIRSGLLSA